MHQLSENEDIYLQPVDLLIFPIFAFVPLVSICMFYYSPLISNSDNDVCLMLYKTVVPLDVEFLIGRGGFITADRQQHTPERSFSGLRID